MRLSAGTPLGPYEILDSPNTQYPSAVSHDGRYVIFTEAAPGTADDVMMHRRRWA